MQQTTKKNYYEEDVIDLKKTVDQLIASRKLIIVITLLFTILASFFEFRPGPPSTFNSTALIEIGQYNFNEQNSFALIENAPALIQDLNIVFIHKENDAIRGAQLSIEIIEKRLIKIGTKAPSIEIATNSLNEIISYIQKRHGNMIIDITQRNLNKINLNLEQLNSEIKFYQKLLTGNIIKRIKEVSQQLPIVNDKINALETIIKEDSANLELIKLNPELFNERVVQPPTLNQIIHSYKDNLFEQKYLKTKLEDELTFLKESLSRINMSLENKSINNVSFDNHNSIKLFDLQQQKLAQKQHLQLLMDLTPINSSLVGEITSVENSSKKVNFIIWGFLLGFVFSIFVVLINDSWKIHKENNT